MNENQSASLPVGAVKFSAPEPLDPRLRVLLIAVRRALIILADGIAEYCDLKH